ncbi:SatD family protein [Arthrobacter bambusae]|nr:hypothetical protein [Arthrobacter bambusae]MDQ0234156.1 hypothetical protein [Arthrobacter bambusae]
MWLGATAQRRRGYQPQFPVGRSSGQRSIREAFEKANVGSPMRRSLWPTVGDEFQAIFFTLGDALLTTSLVRLTLSEGVDCRFGLGRGETVNVDESAPGTIQDGSAWWNAREAIEETHRREHGTEPYLRSWFVSNSESESGTVALVKGFLLLRDASISSMRPRDRRLTAGTLLGYSQTELAHQEGLPNPRCRKVFDVRGERRSWPRIRNYGKASCNDGAYPSPHGWSGGSRGLCPLWSFSHRPVVVLDGLIGASDYWVRYRPSGCSRVRGACLWLEASHVSLKTANTIH